MNYIYRYFNKNNHKNYIGQTNNLERRIREHRSVSFNPHAGNYHDYFHQALRKHGEAAFEIEILWQGENTQEELDALEKHYIQQYHSHVSENGYNLTYGGKQYKKLSQYSKNAEDIKAEIKKGTPYSEITKMFNCSASFISSINHGLRFFDPEETYPLNRYKYFNADDIYPQMVAMLLDPRYRFKDIAAQLNCSPETVKAFNAGRLHKHQYWDKEYPIRDRYFCNRPQWFQALECLQDLSLSKEAIMKKCHVGERVLNKINRGEVLHQDDIDYPIRK